MPARRLPAAHQRLRTALTAVPPRLAPPPQTTLVVKYVLPETTPQAVNWGVQTVIQTAGIMASAVVLWVAQIGGDEYECVPVLSC